MLKHWYLQTVEIKRRVILAWEAIGKKIFLLKTKEIRYTLKPKCTMNVYSLFSCTDPKQSTPNMDTITKAQKSMEILMLRLKLVDRNEANWQEIRRKN